jgi:hypothetical protein
MSAARRVEEEAKAAVVAHDRQRCVYEPGVLRVGLGRADLGWASSASTLPAHLRSAIRLPVSPPRPTRTA